MSAGCWGLDGLDVNGCSAGVVVLGEALAGEPQSSAAEVGAGTGAACGGGRPHPAFTIRFLVRGGAAGAVCRGRRGGAGSRSIAGADSWVCGDGDFLGVASGLVRRAWPCAPLAAA